MKKYLVCSFCLYICWLPINLHAQYPEAKFIPEQFLPENTLAVCVVPDLPVLLQKFRQTLFYEVFLTGFEQSLEDSGNTSQADASSEGENLLREFPILIQQFQQNAGLPFSDLRPLFDRSIAVALMDIAPAENSEKSLLSSELVFLADIGDSDEIMKNILETKVIKAIQTNNPGVEFVVESFAGIDSYVVSNDQFQIYYTFIDNAFILTLNSKTLREVIIASQAARNPQVTQKAASTLFHAASYRAVFDILVQDDHELRVYANIRRLWHRLRPLVYQWCGDSQTVKNRILMELLEHEHLTALGWMFSLKDDGGYERLFLSAITPEGDFKRSRSISSGLLPVLSGVDNGAFSSDRIVPADILYYCATRQDLLKLWQQLIHRSETSPVSRQSELFHSWVENIEETLQINLEQELLPALGQEIAIAWYDTGFRSRLSRPQPALEDFPLALFIQIANEPGIEQILNRLLILPQAENNTSIFRGIEIHACEISGTITPLTVYLAFVRDFFVLSFSRSMIRAIIVTAQQGGDLASNSDYQSLSGFFPDQGYAKGFINLKRILRRIRQQSSIKSFDISSFEARISGMMWVTTVANGGFLTESFSSIGGTVVGLTTVGLGIWLSGAGY